jgi:hypothetical protein
MAGKIYCGAKKTPKNMKRGNMKQCAEKGQVRLYGTRRIDSALVKYKKPANVKQMTKTDQLLVVMQLRGRKDRLIRLIKLEKDETKKNKLKEDAKATLRELKEAREKLQKFV